MMTTSPDMTVAEGPEGLMRVLTDLLEKSKSDPTFIKKDYFYLYKLGGQQAVIMVETEKSPFEFWHYDLMGRPATLPLKETIKKFLWEKCGERERVIKELSEKE